MSEKLFDFKGLTIVNDPDEHIEYTPLQRRLISFAYRKHWWQFWRSRTIWLVGNPSAYSFSYDFVLYDKRNPDHKKLMDELGRPGFTAINFKGIPMTPDKEAGQAAVLYDDTIGAAMEPLYQPEQPKIYRQRPKLTSRRKKK
jgi:hypothetical protein